MMKVLKHPAFMFAIGFAIAYYWQYDTYLKTGAVNPLPGGMV